MIFFTWLFICVMCNIIACENKDLHGKNLVNRTNLCASIALKNLPSSGIPYLVIASPSSVNIESFRLQMKRLSERKVKGLAKFYIDVHNLRGDNIFISNLLKLMSSKDSCMHLLVRYTVDIQSTSCELNNSAIYCINVSETSNVKAMRHDEATNDGFARKKVATSFLVICASAVLVCVFILSIFMTLKYSHRRTRRGRETEEARFDFRLGPHPDERQSVVSVTWHRISSSILHCSKACSCHSCASSADSESTIESDDDEDSPILERAMNKRSKKSRKISYYGTVHMTLMQQHTPIISDESEILAQYTPDISEETVSLPEVKEKRRPRLFSETI